MLKEYPASQHKGDPPRRWFLDDYFDLIVWLDDGPEPYGFQLCYDRGGEERSLTWTRTAGYRHDVVDTGEAMPTKNHAPLLIADGPFPAVTVLERFTNASASLDAPLRTFILDRLRRYGENRGSAVTKRPGDRLPA